MSPAEWASVFRAGEKRTWGWMGNQAAPVIGAVLGAMADRCADIASGANTTEEDL